MSNIIDYLSWRGDVTFDYSPFNEVDALILSQLVYFDFSRAVKSGFTKKGSTLKEASDSLCTKTLLETDPTCRLLNKAGYSRRFGSLRLSGYVSKLDFENEEQFCAMTFSDRNVNYVAFRGTDNTLVGWKEDFNMGYMDTVPAQGDALKYLTEAVEELKDSFVVMGHSKGGNLAIFSSAKVPSKIKKHITAVFNNDGPGFKPGFFNSAEYQEIASIDNTFVPELSLVGMLFEHAPDFIVIKSDEKVMIKQHDPFGWQTEAVQFVRAKERGGQSHFADDTINKWFNEMTEEQRVTFIETLFEILNGSEAKTNAELTADWFNSSKKMLKTINRLDPKTKDTVIKTVNLLVKNAIENSGDLINKK